MVARMLRWSMLFAVAATLAMPQYAEARGRGKSSPFIKTADGYIPKSVYNMNLGVSVSPQKLQQMQAAEKKYAEQKGWIPKSTDAKKPTTTAKKK